MGRHGGQAQLLNPHTPLSLTPRPPRPRAHRFFGMIIPKKYGGLGFSAHGHSQVVMKIASRSGSAAVTVMVPNSLGPGELLMRYGTEPQKDWFLPRLASGEIIPCFGLTGPSSGSDAANMRDLGIVEEQNGVLGVRTTFKKRYITLAPIAGVVGLAFNLKDPKGLLKGTGNEGGCHSSSLSPLSPPLSLPSISPSLPLSLSPFSYCPLLELSRPPPLRCISHLPAPLKRTPSRPISIHIPQPP